MEEDKTPVSPEKAMILLEKNGVKVTYEQVLKILEFMDLFAKLVVNQHVESSK